MSEPLVVVPLDGSELSERAVPYAVAVAEATRSRLLLLTIWEQGEQALITDLSEDFFKQGEEHYQGYLAGVAKKVAAEGVEVETDVLLGDPTEEILRAIEHHDARFLVMATHGRSGLSRWHYGSVASKLAREAPVPTMVVGPKLLQDGAGPGPISHILVPLDGSPLAESALRPALELAEQTGASLLLAQVLRWANQAYTFGVPDIDITRIDRELTEAAEEYLARVRDGLQTERTVRLSVLRGLPADALIDLVEGENIDLVVIASHSRSGVARAMLGSVADRLLQGAAPVLLIRPEGVADVVRARRGRFCHTCGRASPYVEVMADDRCLRCGQHLHVCANCVYFDSVDCLMHRPDVHETYPGLNCSDFQFRETAPQQATSKTKTKVARKA
jgi:nucleotide-binding universal stress UspA family protein